MKLSPVASLYSMGAVLVSVCCKYRLVDGLRKSKITMSYRAVMKGKEYWRLGTSMLLFDLENPLDVYTLVALFMSLSALEHRFFKGSPSSMITTLASIAAVLLVPGFYMRELRLKEPSVMLFVVIATWATIRCFFRPTAGIGSMATSLAPLAPLFAPHVLKGEMDIPLLKHQGMAIAAGLACVLLVPDSERERELRQQRQSLARKKAREVAKQGGIAAGAGAGARTAPVDDSSSEEEEEVEEEEVSDSEEEESEEE